MDWFEAWFDSPLYDKLYANRDQEEARRLIALLEEELPLQPDSNILDLGCGRGRHALTLAREGYRVTGIDLSERAIETAKEKAENEKLDHVHFEVRDMRNPLPEKFDTILNLFTTFGYFLDDNENARVLDSVAKMLNESGTFVVDYLNASYVKDSLVPEDSGRFQDIDYTIKRYIEEGAVHKDITFQKESTGEEKTYSERVKLYDLNWFQQEMDRRNLQIGHVYGDYTGSDYDSKNSPRMLILSCLRQK
jgi:cyclopropane fatty-acyl-phospholipid synthase-like methyltransferase